MAARLPDGMRLYAVGDIHGRADLLSLLLDRIAEDAAAAGARERVLVFVGDYVDRGPDSRGVVERLVRGALPGFALHCLRGNHEQMMLDFLADAEAGLLWLRNGGGATLASYGLFPPDEDAAGLMSCRAGLAAALPISHRRFLQGLPLSAAFGDYLFVHAGIRPGRRLADQDPFELMWIRQPFLSSAAEHGAVVVHGHTPCDRPEDLPNRINVDTGAFLSDTLSCVVLEGAERRFLQAVAPSR
ncbi:MAG TPA: metallophosphoesterase family protein [Alphaproteobacteria bacterium]|nr:metallophosphoesterase family protein [Alphaproteobacteria bacterium]